MAFNNTVPVSLNVSHDSGTNLITFTVARYALNPSTGLYDISQGTELINILASDCSHNEVIGKVVTVQNGSQDEFEITTGWYDAVNNVHYPNPGQTLVDLIDTYIAMNTGGGGGGSTTLFYTKTETEAKALCSGGGVVEGALYQITLDGTSQGNNTDLIFCTGIASTDFGQSMDYFHQSAGRVLHVQGSFTASGFTLLRADEAASIGYSFDAGASTSIDLSEVRMFGTILLQDADGGGIPITEITGLVSGDIITLKDGNSSVLDVTSINIYFPNGFVGNYSFDDPDHDFITIKCRTASTDYAFISGSAKYLGGPRRYVALLNQSGTSAPVATVLDNTLGFTPAWSRTNAGEYESNTFGINFSTDNIIVLVGKPYDGTSYDTDVFAFYNVVNDAVYVRSLSAGTLADNVLFDTNNGESSTTIKVEVYP